MKATPFDPGFDPPAPVLLVRIGSGAEERPAAVLRMLVDTGADCTLVPLQLARSLGLPLVDKFQLQGVGGRPQPAPVFAARLQIGTFARLVRVVGFGDEALIGRDVLNQLVLRIDGPAQSATIARGAKRGRGR